MARNSNRLSPQDTTFLYVEREATQMNIGLTMVFEGPPPSYEELRDHVGTRLSLIPRFRQKLAHIPFGQGLPVWVDDPQFSLDYHVRHIALPPSGSETELRRIAVQILPQRLDRSKPLWEIWLVQGFDEDNRFAIVCKMHHCLADGVSLMDITTSLLDRSRRPKTPPITSTPWQQELESSSTRLLGDALKEKANKLVRTVKAILLALRTPKRAASSLFENLLGIGAVLWAGRNPDPKSPLNTKAGPHQRLASVRADLDEFREIKNSLGGTVNDIVLAVVTGALRRFLQIREIATEGLELKVLVPVSTRSDLERGTLGNMVCGMVVPLPIYSDDPIERLRIVRKATGDVKKSKQPVGTQLLMKLSGVLPAKIMKFGAPLPMRLRLYSLCVSNVRGPQLPLYVLGRELLDIIPYVPLTHWQPLNIFTISYNGSLYFGLTGDYDKLPELDDLSKYMQQSIDDLLAAARPQKLAVA